MFRHNDNKICYDNQYAVVPTPKVPCYKHVIYPRPNQWHRTRVSDMTMKALCYENTFHQQQSSEKQEQQRQDKHRHQPKRQLVIIADKNNTPPPHDVYEKNHLLSKHSGGGGGGGMEEDADSDYEQVELLLGDEEDDDDIFSFDLEEEEGDNANDADYPLSGEHITKQASALESKVCFEPILHQSLKQQHQKTSCNDLSPLSSLSNSTSSSSSASVSVLSLSSTLSSTTSTTSSISTRNVIGKDSSNNLRRYSTEMTTTTKTSSTTKETRLLPVTTRQLSSSQYPTINTIDNKTSFGDVKVGDLISKWESRDDTDLISNTTTKRWWPNHIRAEHVENLRNKKGDYCIRRCDRQQQQQQQCEHERERQCKRQCRSRLDRALCGIHDKCYCRYCTKWDDSAIDNKGDEDLDPIGGFEESKNYTTQLEEEEDDGAVLQQEFHSMNINILDESNWDLNETKAAVVGCGEDSAFDNLSSPFNPYSLTFQ